MKVPVHTKQLVGTSYEIGQALGRMAAGSSPLKKLHTTGFAGFGDIEVKQATTLFARWCPGLQEELQGFADALQVPLSQVVYHGMTYLRPNCSQIALLPSLTAAAEPLLGRNYEFSHEAEDFTLVKTSVAGKYTHMGTSVMFFGRDDGFNECGLAVTMSSCGFPVGPLKNMRAPKVVGLQFWAVIRTLLENCRDVEEALAYLRDMPIAFNINLMLMDRGGHAALMETLDGHVAVQQIDEKSQVQYLHATNHAVLPPLVSMEPVAMRHSLQRYQWVAEKLDGARGVTPADLKKMLLADYPNGLCCHFFKDFFGTTKSMVVNPARGTIDLCWGGQAENGWKQYDIGQPLEDATAEIEICFEPFAPEMGAFLPLDLV